MYRRKAGNAARVRNLKNLVPKQIIVRLKQADKDQCRCGGKLVKKDAAYECGACKGIVLR